MTALCVTLALLVAFLLWSAQAVDQRSFARQTRVVEHLVAGEKQRIPHDQQSVAIWDDAVANTAIAFDRDWIHANLGKWMFDFFGHDRAFVLDASDEPIYGMRNGDDASPASYDAVRSAVAPLAAQLRAELVAGATEQFARHFAPYPDLIDVVRIGEVPALVSIVPIISDTGAVPQAAGTEFLHVSIVELDAPFAERLADEFLLEDANFSISAPSAPGIDSLPILNRSGRVVTFFDWAAYRPGLQLQRQMWPMIGGTAVVGFLIIFVLLERIWRSSRALEKGRQNAAHQATHDILTGLANRIQFDTELAATLAERRPVDEQVALMMLDLDRFKAVNDTLGHEAGDELIRAVGQRLRELVNPADLLARLGGDEFAVVRIVKGGAREAQHLAHSIIDALGKPFEVSGREAFVGVSLGLVLAGEAEHDRQELARKADIALYEAKANGRNRAVVYKDEMNELVQNRHTIESELRKALRRNDQLSVVFQPLFSRATGKIIGAEALARWHHPRLGQISPAHFIPVAEATGLIEAVGDIVLRRATELGARWPGMTIAVNISPTQLRNPRFSPQLFALLKETGMRAADLELEITEGVLLDDDHATTVALHNLRANGVRIALDDFGTGYSSLNYLKRYPVDCIKIDRSFVGQLSSGSVSVAIVQAMVTLAHAMNIEVTAEGVETQEQMTILADMGCNTFQGFLLSTPVTPLMVEGLFRVHGDPAEVSAREPEATPAVA